MAYDRTKRFPKLLTQTPPVVGPGTYYVTDLPKPPQDLDRLYPFLSGTQRTTLAVSKDAHLLPAPDHYYPKDIRHIPERRFGGVSIDFTDNRFKQPTYIAPGPAEYDLPDDLQKKVTKRIRFHPGTWKGPAGKLWLTRPPRSILTAAVSVPSKRDCTGYSINKYGILVKNPPDTKEPTYFYKVPSGELNFTTVRYKGNFWSKMTGRTDFKSFVTPSPAEYEFETKPTPAQIWDEKIRESRRATSRQLRYADLLRRKNLRESFPAPNQYDPPKSAFDKYSQPACKYMPEPPPFNETAKRFQVKLDSGPSPAAHTPKLQGKCFNSIYGAPFSTCAGRFARSKKDTGPGPSDYHTDVGNLAHESAKRFKSQHRSTTQSILQSSSSSVSDEVKDVESPSMYTTEKSCVYHSVFKSQTERFPKETKGVGVPGPGAYETLTAFKANRDRCDFLCRRVAPPFSSRAKRFPKTPKDLDLRSPDPGKYGVVSDISEGIKGGVIPLTKKPKERTTVIGPSYYNIHPYLTSSFLKRSFNVTLGQPKVIKDLQPKKTVPSRTQPSKKLLRWFSTPPKKYQHCLAVC